jgi:tetratricopeptide (TPR) repeat protein
MWAIGLIVVLVVGVGGAAYLGMAQGERDRAEQRLVVVNEHYTKGLDRLDAGEYELAIAEFEYVLKLDPDHPLADQGIAEARARIAQRTPVPTPTSEIRELAADDLYEQSLAYYQAEDWGEAVAVLTQLRVLDATYRTDDVKEMLFESLYNAGMARLDEDRLEEGIFYLDQAIALKPLNEDAIAQRSLAVQYMTALGYWGVDWNLCIDHFEELYATAPNYKDVFSRLYRAHVNYGDAWSVQGEMCPAEIQYAQALQLVNNADTEEKHSESAAICQMATPTPIAPIDGTETITITALPPGFNTGRLAYPVHNSQTGLYDIYGLFADGRLIRLASGADQPSWLWDGGALGFRDLRAPGISVLVNGESAPRLIMPGAGWGWPSFSPDGTKYAYAAQNEGGTWQVLIAPKDHSAQPRIHADGKGPAWGPSGLLAWNGCDAAGACGIFVDNPNDDQPATRLTASANDIALSWAPHGGALAYMSNVSGDWDIFVLDTAGGIVALTDDPASDGLPTWAPDGSGLAFVSNRDGTWGIYLMGPNGEDPHKILTLGPNLPDWTSQRLSWAR